MFLDPLGLVERGQRKIGLARFVGKVAVDRAIDQLRDRLAPEERDPVPVIEAIALSTAEDPAPPVPTVQADHGEAPERADLVLPDYDHLPAAHVVAKLVSLTPKDARRSNSTNWPTVTGARFSARSSSSASRDRHMIDPTIRRCRADDGDVAQLELLEREAREAARRPARR